MFASHGFRKRGGRKDTRKMSVKMFVNENYIKYINYSKCTTYTKYIRYTKYTKYTIYI